MGAALFQIKLHCFRCQDATGNAAREKKLPAATLMRIWNQFTDKMQLSVIEFLISKQQKTVFPIINFKFDRSKYNFLIVFNMWIGAGIKHVKGTYLEISIWPFQHLELQHFFPTLDYWARVSRLLATPVRITTSLRPEGPKVRQWGKYQRFVKI